MDWKDAAERLAAPMFAPLQAALARLPRDRWPTHAELCAAAQGIETESGKALRFAAPPKRAGAKRPSYEHAIASTGKVPTRPRNWHDLFNALAWLTYPRTKGRINAQHVAILAEGGAAEASRRGPERDALTLFDESGVIVASSSPRLLRLAADREWKELFWHRRAEHAASLAFFAFGHALCEKGLAPYAGMVAKCVFLPVDELFFVLPPEAQVARVDEAAAAHFANRTRFASPRAMPPLPVLGIPGWHPDTARESWYDDGRHFQGFRPDASPRSV
jgi:hypothetical protein